MLALFRATLIAVLITASSAHAHDSWISRGGFRGPQNGEWCCGASDCTVVDAQSIKTGEAGFVLNPTNEVVPYMEALPSVDGQYWRCHRPNGTRRCFFAPISAF